MFGLENDQEKKIGNLMTFVGSIFKRNHHKLWDPEPRLHFFSFWTTLIVAYYCLLLLIHLWQAFKFFLLFFLFFSSFSFPSSLVRSLMFLFSSKICARIHISFFCSRCCYFFLKLCIFRTRYTMNKSVWFVF